VLPYQVDFIRQRRFGYWLGFLFAFGATGRCQAAKCQKCNESVGKDSIHDRFSITNMK